MLYNGEEVGDGGGPAGRRRRRPARGHAPDRARPAERDRRDRGRRARLDVLPRRGRLHGEDRGRRRRGRRDRHQRARRPRTSHAVAKAKGRRVTDIRVVVLERDRHDDADRRAARGRRAREPDPRRRRRAGDRRRAPGDRRRPALRDRRHARGRHLGGGAQVRRRRDPGEALAAQRRRAAGARRRPATTSTACSRPTTSSRATTCSSPRPASRPARCCAACATSRDGAITDSIVMRSRSGTVRRIEARHQLSKLTPLHREGVLTPDRPPALQFAASILLQTERMTMAVATHEGIERIEELLGDEAESLLGHTLQDDRQGAPAPARAGLRRPRRRDQRPAEPGAAQPAVDVRRTAASAAPAT